MWPTRSCIIGIITLAIGCSSSGEEHKPRDKPSNGPDEPAAAVETSPLAENAARVLADLIEHESVKDVTCWTSFRKLDWFIAEKSYSEFATLTKITAIKALVRTAWALATQKAAGKEVTLADFDAAVTLPKVAIDDPKQKKELASFANDVGIQNFTDYQKTAEHLRVVLAVIQDEIYNQPKDPLKPLAGPALRRLADAATTFSLLLLKQSGQIAEADKSTFIESAHVQTAYSQIAKTHGLVSKPRKVTPASLKHISRNLAPITGALIEGKTKALARFNKTAQVLVEDLNKVAPIPLTPKATELLVARLQSFARFAARGFDVMRADNFLSDGSYDSAKLKTRPYIDDVYIQNTMTQVFPHRLLNNGDILVRFEPNPGPLTKPGLKAYELTLLEHWADGVRDSAIHWLVLHREWEKQAFAMDPFAAEYLTEVISMMMALYIRQGELMAKELGKTEIDVEVVKRIITPQYVMVPPMDVELVQWDEAKQRAKKQVLAPYRGSLFTNVTAKSGLPTTFVKPDHSAKKTFSLQLIMGGGIAVGDVDADGYPDVFLTGEALGKLYLNNGAKAPGTFRDATAELGIASGIDDGHGALLFDLEGDDDLDLLILRAEHPSMLYVQEAGKFTDAAKAMGLSTHRGAHVASAFDYDGDGDLDVYIGYYGSHKSNTVDPTKRSRPSLDGRNGSPNQLWRNDGGILVEVGAKAGVADSGWTLATSAFDWEADGDLDLYLANDFGHNVFLRNNGDGTFADVTEQTATGDRGSGMNVDVTDINDDGAWDIYVTNIDMFSKRIKVVYPRDESTIDISESLTRAFQYLSGNKLYVSKGAEFVSEEGVRFEPGDRGWGWDAAFFDYENDGDDDLYLTNGWIDGSYAGNQKNLMFINDAAFFYIAPDSSSEAFAGNSRSAANVDIDRDGDLDLIVNNFRQPPVVLLNGQRSGNHWVQIKLAGNKPNPRGIGAIVTVKPAGNGRTIRRNVSAGRGYLSQSEAIVTAGVGKATKVDVIVVWPGGARTESKGLTVDKMHTVSPPGS